MYLAHNNLAWSHGKDLLLAEPVKKLQKAVKEPVIVNLPQASAGDELVREAPRKPIQVFRENGIESLFHFTDASNLESIRKHGLVSWVKIDEEKLVALKNSSETSRHLDESKGLADYKKNPMIFERILRPVPLRINLQVASRPGVLRPQQRLW